jgi:two-component system sensor histidine kinase/response regulator
MSVEQKLNEIFDKDRVMEQVDGDVELLMEMVELFTSGYPELLSNIKNAVTKKDSNLLGRNAHTLKGSVGNFAADSVYDAALSLEIMGHNNDMSHAEEAYIKLVKEIEKLMLAFDILRKEIVL